VGWSGNGCCSAFPRQQPPGRPAFLSARRWYGTPAVAVPFHTGSRDDWRSRNRALLFRTSAFPAQARAAPPATAPRLLERPWSIRSAQGCRRGWPDRGGDPPDDPEPTAEPATARATAERGDRRNSPAPQP